MKTKIKFYIHIYRHDASTIVHKINNMLQLSKSKHYKLIRAYISSGKYKYEFLEHEGLNMLIRLASYNFDTAMWEGLKQHDNKQWEKWDTERQRQAWPPSISKIKEKNIEF